MKKSIYLFISILVIGIMSCTKKETDTTPKDFPPVDIDGNVYDTIRIGTQVWMKQNLKTTRYNDGTPIPTSLLNDDWASTTSGAFAIYNNDNSNDVTYGKLYNWYAANSGKLAPKGWHVPTEAELDILLNNFGGVDVAGCALKATTIWTTPNFCAINSSGFTALPGGVRDPLGTYSDKGTEAYFWSVKGTFSIAYRLKYYDSNVQSSSFFEQCGLSVRCLKD